MPVWVILLVAGVLIVAAFVLVIAIHILDVHAEQQCAHLHDLTHRSLQQQNQSQSHYQYRCGESQLCCVCGSVRNRRSQAISGSNSVSRSKGSSRTGSAGGLLQPLVDAACGKKSLGSGSIECLSGLSSRRHGMASGLQGGWFNARNLFRSSGGGSKDKESQKKLEVECTQDSVSLAAAASSTSSSGSSSSAAAFASASRTVGGSGSSSMTTITATITTTSAPSSASSSSNAGTQASGSHGTDEATWKPASQRRLVLEILMSPAGTVDGQGGAVPRATGVRLKLETNASLESLASLAAAASSGAGSSFQPEADTDADTEAGASTLTAGTTTAACGSVPAIEVNVSKEGSSPGGNGSSCRASGSVVKSGNVQAGLAASAKVDRQKRETMFQGSSTAVCMSSTAAKISVGGGDDCSEVVCGSSAGSAVCVSSECGLSSSSVVGTISSGAANLIPAAACKSKQNGQTVALPTASKSKSKNGTCSSGASMCPLAALVPGGGPSSSNVNVAKGTYHQASFNSSLDGLGSLRISVLDGGTKGKSMKECSKGVTAEIASALAALNVESIGGKGVGMSSSLGVGGVPSEGPTKVDKVDVPQEEEVPGDGSGSEQIVEEGEEHQPAVHAKGEGPEEDEVDGAKKEKRKKKNRGRRQKAKAAAVAAAAASVEAQDRHSHEKQSVEFGEKTSSVLEVEVGCICGTPKGSCHSIGCPYPFTSSGSMVQRKIKEQYDELVRSNVAKSLTLAQVGRFTTCLVEAKSSLQQKSDTIQRRFTIAKSLLSKADKSSFDRLCGQIYGLEIEQKKLEEDTVVYNRLQEQLKLSPAYQKMLEYGRTHFELQPNTGQLIEKVDNEEMEISFEELLAQEKKDSFWQKHGPSRSSVQVS